MITQEQQELLAEIFTESQRPDKMNLRFDRCSNSVTVTYEDLDEQWFHELIQC
jgi:hypothetical protein